MNEDEIAEQIASENEYLKVSDIDVDGECDRR